MMTILIRNANVLHFSDYNVTFQLKKYPQTFIKQANRAYG